MYVYDCPECEAHIERYSSKYMSAEEDTAQVCGEEYSICSAHREKDPDCERCKTVWTCEGILKREEICETQPPNTEGGYQMSAIMSDGSKVAGHFGKTARNKGPSHRGRMISRKGENKKAIRDRIRSEGFKVDD